MIDVILSNAYPLYHPTIFYAVKNDGSTTGQIVSITIDEDAITPLVPDDIIELTTTVSGIYVGQEIDPGQEVTGDLEIRVEQPALQNATYRIRVTIVISGHYGDDGDDDDDDHGWWWWWRR